MTPFHMHSNTKSPTEKEYTFTKKNKGAGIVCKLMMQGKHTVPPKYFFRHITSQTHALLLLWNGAGTPYTPRGQ